MIPRTFRFFPWLLLTLTLLIGGCGGGGAGGGSTQNSPPVLDPIGNQVVNVGETLILSLRASDPDLNDTVRIFTDLNNDPRLSGAAGNPASATFRWTPTSSDLVNNSDTPVSIRFIASDGQLEVSQIIIITVKAPVPPPVPPTNTPPDLAPIRNQSINYGSALSFTVMATDADGDAVTLSVIDLPTGASFEVNTGIFSWTPGPADLGNHNVTFRAADDEVAVEEQIVISVLDNAPVITVTLAPPATVTEHELVTIEIAVTDPNAADTVTVAASGSAIDFGGVFNYDPATQTGSFTWTPVLVTPGSFSITFAASDGTSAAVKTETIVYVRTHPILASDITDPGLRGITIFPQTTPALNGVPELFPGQANFWDIDPDIAQFDGFWNQFAGNMVLAVETGESLDVAFFPIDQTHAQLTFMTPLLSALDGLQVAAVANHASYTGPDPTVDIQPALDEGNASAWLNATADSRLQQAIDLRLVNAPLTLTWKDEFLAQAVGFAFYGDTSDASHYYRVVATDQASGARTVLFDGPSSDGVVKTTPARQRVTRTADLSAFAGKQLVLSFELRGAHQLLNDNTFWGSYARIDNVSLRDGTNAEHVVNGDFESGMTGWTANAGLQSQNLRSAPRDVNGFTITRSFYSVPNQLWARWTDMLENKTDTELTRQIVLRSFLGSAGNGIIYLNGSNQALTSWDGTNPANVPDRDIGLIFGNATSIVGNRPAFSATALDSGDGSDTIDMIHDVTIPARGQVTLVHFALMSGENTGATAIDTTARATTIDTEIANILTNFCSNPRYRDGMTAAQLATLRNFTCP